MRKKVNRLKDISISEISLVDAAAVGLNGKNFIIYKRLTDPDLPELDEPLTEEQEEELNKAFDELNDKEKIAILKELEWMGIKLEIHNLEKALDQIKANDPALYEEIGNYPDRFMVDDDYKFHRKQ
jgi:hypothetical protein